MVAAPPRFRAWRAVEGDMEQRGSLPQAGGSLMQEGPEAIPKDVFHYACVLFTDTTEPRR